MELENKAVDKKRIITIAGKPGSGKSTTADLLAESLGYERYSAGSFLREIATKRGLTIAEASALAITDPSIDHEMDAVVQELGARKENIVVDGRLAFHFIPQSFKVYLDLDLQVAAERIFKGNNEMRRASGESADTVEGVLKNLSHRFESEQARYQSLYDIDPRDPSHFDLVVDTTLLPPTEVTTRIVSTYHTWLST